MLRPTALCLCVLAGFPLAAQVPGAVVGMAANESYARLHLSHFAYLSEERSERTGGHLWRERVVEVGDGMLRRLTAVDGRALADSEVSSEVARLQRIGSDPAAFQKEAQAHKDDDIHAARLLELLPRAFLFSQEGTQAGCTQYRFQPDPKFSPATYEERVGAAMAGTVSIQEPGNRLCVLQAAISRPVTFGFGLLGKVEQGGNFRLARVPVADGAWKTQSMSVHLGGKILMMKSLGREQETRRSEIRLIPNDLSLQGALQMLALK